MTTSTTTTTYTVWAVGVKREWIKYEGPDLSAATVAYNKAQASGKWGEVYIEVDGGTARYTPQQLH